MNVWWTFEICTAVPSAVVRTVFGLLRFRFVPKAESRDGKRNWDSKTPFRRDEKQVKKDLWRDKDILPLPVIRDKWHMDITGIFCCWGTNQTTADSSWSSQFPASRNTFNHSLPCNTVECGSVENSFRLFVFFAFSLWCKSPNHLAPSLTTSNINSPSFVSATKVIRKWRSSNW